MDVSRPVTDASLIRPEDKRHVTCDTIFSHSMRFFDTIPQFNVLIKILRIAVPDLLIRYSHARFHELCAPISTRTLLDENVSWTGQFLCGSWGSSPRNSYLPVDFTRTHTWTHTHTHTRTLHGAHMQTKFSWCRIKTLDSTVKFSSDLGNSHVERALPLWKFFS